MSRADRMRRGYHDLLRREIVELIPQESKSILDLGCGTGILGKAIKERQNCRFDGIELSKEAAEEAKKNIDHAWCDNLNRFDPTFIKQKYDTLVFADILEHLINPWHTLAKFSRLLSENGTVVASIPNIAHPLIVANLQKGIFRYEPAGILDITHLRFFTRSSICQMFYKAGLKIVNIKAHPTALNPTQFLITAVKRPVEVLKPAALVLILTHNNWPYTKMCIDSIKKYTHTPHRILVIDNGSTDETVEELRKDKSICHIENSSNLGFSKGFNVGLTLVDTPYFVLVNNDTVVTDGWLARMIYHIEEDKDLMLLGARTNKVSGPQRVDNVWYHDEASLQEYASHFTRTVENPITYFPRIVFFFTLFKTEVLSKIGFLDEIFNKGNYEDDDYCMRVAKKNLQTAYDNTVFIHHYGSVSFKKDPQEFNKILFQNKQKFMKKHNLTQYFGQRLDEGK